MGPTPLLEVRQEMWLVVWRHLEHHDSAGNWIALHASESGNVSDPVKHPTILTVGACDNR